MNAELIQLSDHFVDVNKMADLGSSSKRWQDDFMLSVGAPP